MLRLQYERRRRGLSQESIAVVARLHQPVVSMIENGRLIPTPKQLERLAEAFRIQPASQLLEHVVIVREQATR